MRCAKCGNEIGPTELYCPTCGTGRAARAREEIVHCPNCGSTQITAVRRTYSPGCGCLGLLLFGWWGLLLGLLGVDDVELVCAKCGTRWPAGSPSKARSGIGCGTLLLIVLLIILLSYVFHY